MCTVGFVAEVLEGGLKLDLDFVEGFDGFFPIFLSATSSPSPFLMSQG